MKLTYQFQDLQIEIQAERDGEGWHIRLPDGSEHRIHIVRHADSTLEIHESPDSAHNPQSSSQVDRIYRIPCGRTERGIEIAYKGEVFVFPSSSSPSRRRRSTIASGTLTAPMVGVVADLLVKEGEAVTAYQPLAVVEAMKVMASLEAPFAGIVEKVYVQKGARVSHGEPILALKPDIPDS